MHRQKLVLARKPQPPTHKKQKTGPLLTKIRLPTHSLSIQQQLHPMSPYSSSSVLTGTASDNYEEYANEDLPSVESSKDYSSRSGTTNISSGHGTGNDEQQLFFITSYSNFDKLAHGPRGNTAKHTLRTYKFSDDGSLVLLHIAGDGESVLNPAFSRFHPR